MTDPGEKEDRVPNMTQIIGKSGQASQILRNDSLKGKNIAMHEAAIKNPFQINANHRRALNNQAKDSERIKNTFGDPEQAPFDIKQEFND